MLDTLRRGANTFVAKFLLGLLTLCFVGWGIGSRIGSPHSETVATVGDARVTLGEFQAAYQRDLQAFSRQTRQPVTPDMARALGLPQQVLSGLIARATVRDVGDSLGLGLSDARLADTIANDPTLRAPGSQSFDRAFFAQLLAQNNLTEKLYVDERRQQAIGQQLSDGLVAGVVAPKAMTEALMRYQGETRTVEYVTLARGQVEPIPAPKPEVLAAWYDQHKAAFRAPELRSIRALSLTATALADPASVTDEAARREYQRTISQYQTAEARRVEQIPYPSDAAAEAAEQKLAGGASFDDLLADAGLKPDDADLGLLTRDKFADANVATAAWALAKGGVSQPVKSAFGPVILRVTDISPAHQQPYEEVAAAIKASISATLADRALGDTRDEIEDALAGGATLEEVATRFKLKLSSFEADSHGNAADGEAVADIPEEDKLLTAAFAAEEGSENEPLQVDHGFLWYEVAKVTPGRDRTLDEVHDKALSAWTDDEAQGRLTAKAEGYLDRIRAGTAIADIATEAGVELETAAAITRRSDDPGLGGAGIEAAFGGPVGHAEAIDGPDGTRVVLRVASIEVPPVNLAAGEAVDVEASLSQALEQSLFSEFVGAAQDSAGTTVNQQLVNAVAGNGGN